MTKNVELLVAGDATIVYAADGATDDAYGWSVAIDGDYMVVGCPWNNGGGTDSGAAYIYERIAGVWTQVLKVSGAGIYVYLGAAVAVSGTTIAIGNPDYGTYYGRVYVYERTGGTWVLQADIPSAFEGFGHSIALDGDIMIVGPKTGGWNTARAYHRSGGVWTGKSLNQTDVAGGDSFGCCVALRGNRALIGGPYDDDGGSESGSAWFFEYDPIGGTWTQTLKVPNPDPYAGDHFGMGVAIDSGGELACIASPNDDEGGSNVGALYIYEWTGATWSFVRKVIPDYAQSMHVGSTGSSSVTDRNAMAMANGVVYAGAHVANSSQGLVATFAPNPDWATGYLERALQLTPYLGTIRYGWSVCCDGALLAAGATKGTGNAASSGIIVVSEPTFVEGGSGGDTTAPTVTVSPAAGTPITATDIVTITVTDAGTLQRLVLLAKYAQYQPEVIWDGYAFQRPFLSSVQTAVGGGVQLDVQRTGGWKAGPSIQVIAIDAAGNEA